MNSNTNANLKYFLSLVNGYVLLKSKNVTKFGFQSLLDKVIALAKRKHSIKLSLEIWSVYDDLCLKHALQGLKEQDLKYLGFIKYMKYKEVETDQ